MRASLFAHLQVEMMSVRLLCNIRGNVAIFGGRCVQMSVRQQSKALTTLSTSSTCTSCAQNQTITNLRVSPAIPASNLHAPPMIPASNLHAPPAIPASNLHTPPVIPASTILTSDRSSSNHQSTCQYATYVPTRNPGIFKRLKEQLGFTGKLRYSKSLLMRSGLRMYLCCAELVDHENFFKEFHLPDTFNSWFRITELHIWLVMCRLSSEQQEGVLVRNGMIRFWWEDMAKKAKKLGGDSSLTKRGILELSEQFRGQLVTYDEGLLDDDKVLAGALWRGFFDGQCEDIEKLELLVHYVRKQIQHLDRVESGVLLSSGLVDFLQLTPGDTSDKRTKHILEEILRRA